MSRPELSFPLIRAASMDAGNRSMRAAGRSEWNAEDSDVASAEYQRLVLTLNDPGVRYAIVDLQTRAAVYGDYKSRKRAQRRADRLNLEYGAHRYSVRRKQENR